MVSKVKIAQSIRDILLLIFSLVVVLTTYPSDKAGNGKYAIIAVALLWGVLNLVDLILVIARTKKFSFFYANAIFQIIPSLVLTVLGIVMLVWFALLIGLLLMLTNLLILRDIIKRKKELVKRTNSNSYSFNRTAQYIRDIMLIGTSVILMASSYGKWIDEPAHYVLFALAGIMMLLSLINILLMLIKVKSRGYFYFNSIIQMVFALLFIGLGPTMPIGIILIVLNIIILITLRKKKVK